MGSPDQARSDDPTRGGIPALSRRLSGLATQPRMRNAVISVPASARRSNLSQIWLSLRTGDLARDPRRILGNPEETKERI